MSGPIKVLLIDDEKEFCVSISGEARSHRILIDHVQNLEMGMEKLTNDKTIQFVILDGKCLIDQDQATPKNNFVYNAISKINELCQLDDRYIPFCVNTGFMDDFAESLDGLTRVFKKGADNTPLFEYVKGAVANTPEAEIENRYQPAFQVFQDQILDSTTKPDLIKLVQKIKESYDPNNFNSVRKVLEEIYLVLIHKYNFIPKDFVNRNNLPNLTACSLYMTGRPTAATKGLTEFTAPHVIPDHIAYSCRFVTEITSAISHTYKDKTTRYLYQAVMLALLEILCWLPNFIKSNYPK